MESWWAEISLLNKAFVTGAVFFTVLFVWQLVGLLAELPDAADGEASGGMKLFPEESDGPAESQSEIPEDGIEGITFSLVSLRSLIAFGTLFSWSGTLYLATGTTPLLAVLYSFGWGIAAMFGVSYLVYRLLHLQEVGNASLYDSLGEEGSVYIRIPEGGTGKVRIRVGETVSFVNAVCRGDKSLDPGSRIRVIGVADSRTVVVEPDEE